MDTVSEAGLEVTFPDGLSFADLDSQKDSVWYEGEVFRVTDPETKLTVIVEAVGEVRIRDNRKAKQYRGNEYRSGYHLSKDGRIYTDKHLFQLLTRGSIEFLNNSWFECLELREGTIESYECIHHDTKEALGCATTYLLDTRAEKTDDPTLWEE
jgi:hypothetical protein